MRFCSFFSVPRKIPARFLPLCGSQFRSIWMCIIKNPFAPESSQRQRVTVCYGRMWVASVCVRVMLGGYTVCNSLFKKKLNSQKGSEPSWWWGWHMCKLWRIFCLPAFYTCVGFVNGSVGIYSFGKKMLEKLTMVKCLFNLSWKVEKTAKHLKLFNSKSILDFYLSKNIRVYRGEFPSPP